MSDGMVGYYRPIDAANRLRAAGWNVESREHVNRNGFRSEVLVCAPTTINSSGRYCGTTGSEVSPVG